MEVLAVNVTFDPAQMVVPVALIEIVGVTKGVTDMVSELLVAVGVTKHAALLIKTQVIISPFTKLLVEKFALLVPAFNPFTFH